MFPLQGMGSNGLGMAGGSGLGGGGMAGVDPRMLAALMGGGGMQGAPSPLAQGGAMTPMANMIGGGMSAPRGGGMPPSLPGLPPVAGAGMAGPQQPNGIASIMSTPQGLQALLAALKGGQTGLPNGGVPPAPPGAPPGNPNNPAYTQGMGGVIAGAPPPQPDMWQRLMGWLGGGGGGAGGFTGGAPSY